VDRTSRDRQNRGLTLIELLLVLVVLAISLQVVVPGMQQLIRGNRLRTEAGRLLAALNLARSEAVIRNAPVSLCPSAMAGTGVPGCAGAFSRGWMVFTDPDRNGVFDPGEEPIRAFEALPAGYALTDRSGGAAGITYLPDGSSRRNRTLLLCPPPGRQPDSWSVVLNSVGRARAVRAAEPCPAGSA